MTKKACANSLAHVFNDCFLDSYNTRLETGAEEPFYIPANVEARFSSGAEITPKPYARIFSRADYPASVLHEAAHWCIAGRNRRQRLDYGYWYEPDGRDQAQQGLFERVEVAPQAIERVMSCAAGMAFRLSADNANASESRPSESFRKAVHQQTIQYLDSGLPEREQIFA